MNEEPKSEEPEPRGLEQREPTDPGQPLDPDVTGEPHEQPRDPELPQEPAPGD